MARATRKNLSAAEADFLEEVEKVKDLLVKSNGFSDLTKPLSTNMTFSLLAEFHVIQRQALDREIGELRQAIEDLKGRTMSYRGVWGDSEVYRKGDVTTHAGSAWHCEAASSVGQRPGAGAGWRLMVKRGRDASQ